MSYVIWLRSSTTVSIPLVERFGSLRVELSSAMDRSAALALCALINSRMYVLFALAMANSPAMMWIPLSFGSLDINSPSFIDRYVALIIFGMYVSAILPRPWPTQLRWCEYLLPEKLFGMLTIDLPSFFCRSATLASCTFIISRIYVLFDLALPESLLCECLLIPFSDRWV